ncbi:hypothetical protein [Streptomyces sp. NPDC102462]|uniref:hypothetical protein n=1 Tax=Streptomyces sp. NPDC102462 TaxID=3366178 RepID=UPI003811AF69
MDVPRGLWGNTTHDWSKSVDADHLAHIRRSPEAFAPGGPWHLVLEVLAYAADEAAGRGRGRCVVTVHPKGSVSVAHGIPVTGLEPVEPDGTTGTLVHFRPDEPLRATEVSMQGWLPRCPATWPDLNIRLALEP